MFLSLESGALCIPDPEIDKPIFAGRSQQPSETTRVNDSGESKIHESMRVKISESRED